MNKKNIVLMIVIIICLIFACFTYIFVRNNNFAQADNQESAAKKNDTVTIKKDKSQSDVNKMNLVKESKKISEQNNENHIKKVNLYSNIPSSMLPLSGIAEIADLQPEIQNAVTSIAENNNIYMIQRSGNKLLIITDNPENIRHNIEFTEISLHNGHQIQTTFGYNDKISDSDNDIWDYDQETKMPIRHTKYNKNGDVEFTEIWNYQTNEPIKYEMKDSDGRVISIKKETQQGDSDLRVEHLIYDKDGNTKMNVSATYEGEDLKRFTFYNADKPEISGSIFSDYADGLKVKEIVYTSDLKLKEEYTSDYKDGVREDIKKFNDKNVEVQKYTQTE